jgi:hypothetical protein
LPYQAFIRGATILVTYRLYSAMQDTDFGIVQSMSWKFRLYCRPTSGYDMRISGVIKEVYLVFEKLSNIYIKTSSIVMFSLVWKVDEI